MKKSEIITIVVVALTSILIAFFVARSIFGDIYRGTAKVRVMNKIVSDVAEPDPEVFNERAINPTVRVLINRKD